MSPSRSRVQTSFAAFVTYSDAMHRGLWVLGHSVTFCAAVLLASCFLLVCLSCLS